MPGAASERVSDSRVEDFFSDPDRYRRRNADLPVRPVVVRRLLGDCSGRSILDLCCGDGSLTMPLCGEARLLVLLDRSVAMLEVARASMRAECVQRVHYEACDLSD
jgi:ubiquinone/menaquinone biosynthesis C-methylase UbiE